jgi:hypothetical protein
MQLTHTALLTMALALLLQGACASHEHAKDKHAGELGVIGQFVECPLIVGMTILPLEVIVGGQIELQPDLTREVKHAQWSASSGHFEDDRRATTTFVCDAVGEPVLMLAVEDASACAHRMALRVRCSAPMHAAQ